TDAVGTVPGDYTFSAADHGSHTFAGGVTLLTAGNQSLTASDVALSSITGATAVSVSAAAATHLAVNAPPTAFAGIAFGVTVRALDVYGNTATNYIGAVHINTTDLGAVVPSDYTFIPGDQGSHAFNNAVTLVTLGSQTLAASDTVATTIAGNTAIAVHPAPATHFSVSAPAHVNAGSPFTITVTALDQFNHVATTYAGLVHFTKSDAASAALVPPDYTFVSGDQGLHTFTTGATLIAAGNQSVTATDAAASTITASALVTVDPLAATHFALSAPGLAIAHKPFNIALTALDIYDNTATGYAGAVHFDTTDFAPDALVPGNYMFLAGDHGSHTFANGVNLVSLGDQTLSASDTSDGTITGSAVVNVPVSLSIPTTLTGARGDVVSVPINVSGLYDPITGNGGLVGASMVLRYDANWFTFTGNVGLGSVPMASFGWNIDVNAFNTGILGITLFNSFGGVINDPAGGSLVTVDFQIKQNVPFGAVSRVDLVPDLLGGAPVTGMIDNNFSDYNLTPRPEYGPDETDGFITVAGTDHAPAANNESYSITARTSAGDPALVVTSPGVLANDSDVDGDTLAAVKLSEPAHGAVTLASDGSFVYTPTLGYLGPDSFTYLVSDGELASSAVTVSLTVAPRLSIPTNLTGTPGGSVVVPVNIDNPNPAGSGGLSAVTLAINYDPAVFTLSAADVQLGTATSTWQPPSVTLNQATGQLGISMSSATPVTTTAPASLVQITFHIAPGAAAQAAAINLAANNLPGATTVSTHLDNKFGGQLALRPAVTNAANDAGVDGVVTILAPTHFAVAAALTPTPTGFVAQFTKPFDPSTLNLYDAASAHNGPADVTLLGPSGMVRGSLVVDPSYAAFTFIKSGVGTNGLFAGVLPAGSYTVTLRSAQDGFKDAAGTLLDGNNDGAPGDDYVASFTVAASPNPVLSIPDFARGPGAASDILVPNATGAGIPITLTRAVNVTDVTFNLTYNTNLLNITSTLNGPSGVLTLLSASGGVARFSFHSDLPLSGKLTLGQIVAQVPNGAAATYQATELLHLSNIVINGANGNALNDDGVHVVAFLGDTFSDGSLSPLDGAMVSRVATARDSGFGGYRLVDPAIVGDFNNNGFVDSGDATLMNRWLAGMTVPQLLTPTPGLPLTPVGPDPTLSLPTSIQALPGETVMVPVTIDTARPDGSTGLMEAILALRFDPQVFSVSAADVHLGTLLATNGNWQLSAAVNGQTGEIGIEVSSIQPLLNRTGGSLAIVTMHVKDTAPLGATALNLVPEVNPTGKHVYRTAAADGQGMLILHPAVTEVGNDAYVDGQIIVAAQIMGSPVDSARGAAAFKPMPGSLEAAFVPDNVDADLTPRPLAEESSLAAYVLEHVFGDLDAAHASLDRNSNELFSIADVETAVLDSEVVSLAAGLENRRAQDVADAYYGLLGRHARASRKSTQSPLLDGEASNMDDWEIGAVEENFANGLQEKLS
ncbi:MAG TPA: cohesin domain-containing protein, partial [Gemmataceae bacterium]|nr:cohesin domain-containing protein [Gemmataceae bacterium]